MTETKEGILIDASVLVDLAVYAWRLDLWTKQESGTLSLTVPRYVVRGINKMLNQYNISAVDMTGSQFDSGLACDVVDSIEVDSLPPGASIIAETVAPIVNIDGQLARHGQVVIHTGRAK